MVATGKTFTHSSQEESGWHATQKPDEKTPGLVTRQSEQSKNMDRGYNCGFKRRNDEVG